MFGIPRWWLSVSTAAVLMVGQIVMLSWTGELLRQSNFQSMDGCPNEPPITIVYSGPTNNALPQATQYAENTNFFIDHGLPCGHPCADHVRVVFVLTADSLNDYRDQITTLNDTTCNGRIEIMIREDRCYDMESARVAISRLTILPHERFLFVNCGMLGPVTSSSSDDYWANKFSRMITDEVKLSGVSLNCGGKLGVSLPHIQSMLWCTDGIGLKAIMRSGAIYDCGNQLNETDGRSKLINRYELGLSKAIMQGGNNTNNTLGWKIQSIIENRTFNWSDVPTAKCDDQWHDPSLIEKYSPDELVFWKVTRIHQQRARQKILNMTNPNPD